tara:strand:+ start:3018 stop:3194 length:177 start_codon:yes stop_codon:yes gene_type:complete
VNEIIVSPIGIGEVLSDVPNNVKSHISDLNSSGTTPKLSVKLVATPKLIKTANNTPNK